MEGERTDRLDDRVALVTGAGGAIGRAICTTPLGRLAVPEDVADVALFLVSDERRFMTGAMLPIDGGRMITA